MTPAAIVACLCAVSAYAQEPSAPSPAPAPANLAFVEGTVEVVQDGVTERANPPVMLIEGDVVRTRSGRAEVVFGDGSLLHLSQDSELEILGDEHLRLLTGRAILRMSHAAARPYVIDTPASSVRLEAEGEYTIATDRTARLEVAVTRGTASIGDTSQWTIGGGHRVTFAGAGARPLIESFNSARLDAFESWAYERTNGFSASHSAAQLPYELRPYAGVFDQHGRWDYVAPHGYVWFPSVGVSWRPYYDGWWSFTRYGWTWHGRERWAWPTHHYGRWGLNGAFWYWIPAKRWAPAWVSWTVASGYVGWAPFGWQSGYSPGRWRRDHPAYAPHDNHWRGWTFVPRDHFAPRRYVRTHAVDGERLDESTRRALMAGATAVPRANDLAVSRDEVTVPGARGAVRRRDPIPPSRRSTSGVADHPAYTPPASWNGSQRRGAVRGLRTPEASPRSPSPQPVPQAVAPPRTTRDAGAGSTPRAVPRRQVPEARAPQQPSRARSGAARSPGAVPRRGPTDNPRDAQSSGAVRRGGAARAPATRGSSPAAQGAPSQQRPSAQGGARRRPGGQ